MSSRTQEKNQSIDDWIGNSNTEKAKEEVEERERGMKKKWEITFELAQQFHSEEAPRSFSSC